MNYGERLRELRKNRKLSANALSRLVDLDPTSIYKIEGNDAKPSLGSLERICDALGVSLSEFFSKEAGDQLAVTVTETASIEKLPPAVTSLPILGHIRAGVPILAEDNWQEQIEVPSHLRADFALRVEGDSMSWAGIHPGDIAILRLIDNPSHGMIVAAGIEAEQWTATLKFYVQENGCPKLRAANPDYEDMPVTAAHRIIGQVVGIQKEPPSLSTYRELLVAKEIVDQGWKDVVNKSVSAGIKAQQVTGMVEMHIDLAKRMRGSEYAD